MWQFADLQFADQVFFPIFGFVICQSFFLADLKFLKSPNTSFFSYKNLRICDWWTGTPKKFVDLRINHKNLQICDLLTDN
jgi:hypothetical protein